MYLFDGLDVDNEMSLSLPMCCEQMYAQQCFVRVIIHASPPHRFILNLRVHDFLIDNHGVVRQANESDEEAGPMPIPQLDELHGEGERGVNYGGALLPGEGAAIAQFVQKGLRIPRRGEVGWAGQEIERLEDSG